MGVLRHGFSPFVFGQKGRFPEERAAGNRVPAKTWSRR
jgi:hypothetical protein